MALWLAILSYVLFLLNMWEQKHLIKVLQHLNSDTEFCLFCQALFMLDGLNSLTLLHLGWWLKPVPSQGFSQRFQVSLESRGFLSIWLGNNGMGPLVWEMLEFHGICIQEGIVTPRINAWASAPISHTPCWKLAISRMKRGGVEKVMVSRVFQASLVWSVPPPPECQCWCPHTPNPPTSNFSPFI